MMENTQLKKHYAIIVPGLGDNVKLTALFTQKWPRYGLTPIVCSLNWRGDEKKIQPRLDKLLKLIDSLRNQQNKISLIGCSAGGSAALNAFFERRDSTYKVINICGRLRLGELNGFRSLKIRAKTSPAFAESVKLWESRENALSENDKLKIMTISPLFGDELVPASTVSIQGVKNIRVPLIEHTVTIYAALSLFSKPLINFLKN